jgi:WD40 repeat protein
MQFVGHNPRDVWSLAFSPDGRWLASGGLDGLAKIWDAKTGREQATLRGNIGDVWAVAFSPDGKRLATGSGYGETKGEVKVWDSRLWESATQEGAR